MENASSQILQSFLFVMLAGALFAVFLTFMANKKSRIKERKEFTEGGNTELFSSVFLEINKLPLSPSQRVQTLQSFSHLFDRELQKRLDLAAAELGQKHEKVLEDKEQTIRFVEEQYRLASEKCEMFIRNYEKIGMEKRQTEAIVRSMAEGLIVVDKEGRILLMNPSAERLLGVKKEEKMGKPIFDNPKDEALVAWAENISGVEEKEIVLKSKEDETRVVVRASNAVIENEDGQTMGMVSILTNVTKQKELDELKSQFVANVSHELRSPLYTVQESLSHLLEKTGGDPEKHKLLTLAKGEMERLTRLINNLLDLSKMEARKFHLNPTLFRLEELLENIVETLQAWAQSKRLTIQLKPVDGPLEVRADADHISQVLHNLLGNALKFTPPGGRITLEAKKINGTETGGPERVRVRVQDTGPGISQEDCGKIFSKFVQLNSPHLAGVGGTGLGLAISKEIIEYHQGKIWVESEEGKGSGFIFEIPSQPL